MFDVDSPSIHDIYHPQTATTNCYLTKYSFRNIYTEVHRILPTVNEPSGNP